MNDGTPQFNADDLASLGTTPADEAAPGGDKGAGGQESKPAAQQPATEQKPASEPAKDGKPTIAGGGTEEEQPKTEAAKPYWPDNWREKLAEHIAAGDKKAYDRELKRLQRIADPSGVYGMYRELDNRLNGGGLIKVPGKDAKPEDIESFHKALGVPEKPEDYFKDIKLDNGAVIGEADKPIVDIFAAAMHKAGATPAVMTAVLNTYYARQEEIAAQQDDADDEFHRESLRTLKEEWGPSLNRRINSIHSIFATAPGGADASNPNSLLAQVNAARLPDGKRLGNHPDWLKLMSYLASEVNPEAAVVEDGKQGSMTIESELGSIQQLRKTDPKKYWSKPVQDREEELIAAQQKVQARQRA